MNLNKKGPLGRGLESLIPKSNEPQVESNERLLDIDITDIIPNDHQPRKDFDPEALEALTNSVREKGIMQPLVVTKKDDKYMIIAGERRWRAAGLAGLRAVPAVVIPFPQENDRLELALIENTQRDDLKPLELAKAYLSLIERCNYRQEDVAKVAGKSRSAVANTLRLLELKPEVMAALEQKLITEGHARVFLTLDEDKCRLLLDSVLKDNLSVRQTEALAKKLQTIKEAKVKELDPDMEYLRKEMESFFGSKVKFKGANNSGVIEIKYESAEDLDRIVNKLRGELC